MGEEQQMTGAPTVVVITQAIAARLMGSCHMPSRKGPGSKLLCFHTRITMGMPSAHACYITKCSSTGCFTDNCISKQHLSSSKLPKYMIFKRHSHVLNALDSQRLTCMPIRQV